MYNEVYEIISESKQDTQVELKVARPIAPGGIGLSSGGGPSGAPGPSSSSSGVIGATSSMSYLSIRNKHVRRPSVTVTSPTSPDPSRLPRFGPVQQAKIQLKIWFDPVLLQLSVTVLSGTDLTSRHGLPNPFAKLCLLPDPRSVQSPICICMV